MIMNYEAYAQIMKALSDPKRIKILDMLSCGDMCACDILEHFDFTQPTLSHHIKVLVNAGLVTMKKEGTWHHYSINDTAASQLIKDTITLLSAKDDCICATGEHKEGAKCNEKTGAL